MGKSFESYNIDPEVLKRGEQMGFDTPVVHALTSGNVRGGVARPFSEGSPPRNSESIISLPGK